MLSKSPLLVPGSFVRLGREADVLASRLARSLKAPLQFLSFWGAIGLPFAHLGLLVNGLESTGAVMAFVALLALNVVALYVGHGYKRD